MPLRIRATSMRPETPTQARIHSIDRRGAITDHTHEEVTLLREGLAQKCGRHVERMHLPAVLYGNEEQVRNTKCNGAFMGVGATERPVRQVRRLL